MNVRAIAAILLALSLLCASGCARLGEAAKISAQNPRTWARVEAGKHHPSDVLVGWALGNFVGETAALAFFNDTTMNLDLALSSDLNYVGLIKQF